jgi:serralysin
VVVTLNKQGMAQNTGGAGSDTLISIENLIGSIHGDRLTGDAAANSLTGGAGNDYLEGGFGRDQLTGGAGADRFVFEAAFSSNNVDAVTDFASDDFLVLDRSIFTAITANGQLAESAFRVGPAAADANDRIVYDQASGRIFYDADGNGAGAAILFARVEAGTALTHADIPVVA